MHPKQRKLKKKSQKREREILKNRTWQASRSVMSLKRKGKETRYTIGFLHV
jgi:hypothetical protein